MSNAYIVATARTPIGRFGGQLKNFSPVDLGAHAIAATLKRAGISGSELDLFIIGNVLRAGHGQLLPRQAAIKAGVPTNIDGFAIDMVCSSGMMSVMQAATMIKAGESDLILAGGMESMSQAGFYLSSRARWGYKYLAGRPEQFTDILERDGLSDPFNGLSMGEETERLATQYDISREEVDEVAFHSHHRAAAATQSAAFADEIAPIELTSRHGSTLMTADEGIRADISAESLAKLPAAFTLDGILTAGNASQISDGAAMILLASETAVKRHNLTPIAKVTRGSWTALESWRFAEAPIPALQILAEKGGFDLKDVDLFENNEAFAINSVLLNRQLDIPYDKINIRGGAVALGHPIGCTGARIIVTLLNALRDSQGTLGVASLCHGTGGSTAIALEMLN